MQWEYKDKGDKQYRRKGNFKARKNFVLDITSTDDLSNLCFSQECFPDNTAIIKSELAKIRIAVASALPLYMFES